MSRSFKGFLQAYAQELTGRQTTSLKKLSEAVVGDSPRAAETLLLLALASGREDYLMRQVRGTSLEGSYRAALVDLERTGGLLEPWLEQLPDQDRYRKVWNAWRSEATRLERDRRMLPGVRDAIERIMAEQGMTRAQACRVAGLNKGNFYAFMKGDVSRLSRETAVNAYRRLASG